VKKINEAVFRESTPPDSPKNVDWGEISHCTHKRAQFHTNEAITINTVYHSRTDRYVCVQLMAMVGIVFIDHHSPHTGNRVNRR
jgi:hypothetical protein